MFAGADRGSKKSPQTSSLVSNASLRCEFQQINRLTDQQINKYTRLLWSRRDASSLADRTFTAAIYTAVLTVGAAGFSKCLGGRNCDVTLWRRNKWAATELDRKRLKTELCLEIASDFLSRFQLILSQNSGPE